MDTYYSLYTSCPIDHWDDFWHISKLHIPIINILKQYQYNEFTYNDVWKSVMDKLYWAWTKCGNVDKELRNSDIYIYLDFKNAPESFQTSILFKSDNNGTVNLIIDQSFDENEYVLKIPHEFGGEWEKMC